MRAFTGFILFLSLTFSAAYSAGAQEAKVEVGNVLSAISDYTDSIYYRSVLVSGDEDADLYIFTGRGDEKQLATYAKNIAITGIGGIDAYLKRSPSGALQIVSENIAIGRHRWERTLTIVYRNDQFVVGGYTYNYYDTLATDDNGDIKSGKCDLNLLTGRGILDDRPIRTKMKALPVAEWNVDFFPPACDFD